MPLQALLFFVVKQVAAGALAKAGGALFDKIHHPDEPEKDELKLNEKILDEIRALGVSIEEVKVAIAALSNQIAEAVVALRKDDLRESASAIGTQYATVNDILRAIQKVKADTTLPEKERQAKFTVLYDRLKDCLKEAAESVPAYLDLINDALADPTMNSLVQEIAGVVLKKSVDVVHYYYQTMTEVGFYWFAVLRGLSLLWMALGEPGVFLPEGSETYERQKAQLENQQRIIRALLGEKVCSMAETLLGSGNTQPGTVMARFSLAQTDIGLGSHTDAGKTMAHFFDQRSEIWNVELGLEVQDDIKAGKTRSDYRMTISNKGTNYVFAPYTPLTDAGIWVIRPIDVKGSAWVLASLPSKHGLQTHFMKSLPYPEGVPPVGHSVVGTAEGAWIKVEELPNESRFMIELVQ